MCNQKVLMENGQLRSCHRCWQCRATRANDVVGRVIAERIMSPSCDAVTWTYGGDDKYYGEHRKNPHAINYYWEDVQTQIMRLRNNSDGLRYFVAGQAGKENGRVHWHAMMFWQGQPVPNIVYERRYMHLAETGAQAVARGSRYETGKQLWHHGWSFWEEAHDGVVDYITRYISRDLQKGFADNGIGKRKFYGASDQPPMGTTYFVEEEARRYVEAGLAPTNLFYSLPGVYDPGYLRMLKLQFLGISGGPRDLVLHRQPPLRRFLLRGGCVRHYLDAFVTQWEAAYGDRRWQNASPLLDAHMDDMARRARRAAKLPDEPDADFEAWHRQRHNGVVDDGSPLWRTEDDRICERVLGAYDAEYSHYEAAEALRNAYADASTGW